jgi:hypothetical protein
MVVTRMNENICLAESISYVKFLGLNGIGDGYIRVRKEFNYMHTPHPVDPLFSIILFFFCH